jgi:DNA repair exonuclease SbcCD ATPase subunit
MSDHYDPDIQAQKDYEALNAQTALDLNKAKAEIERLRNKLGVFADGVLENLTIPMDLSVSGIIAEVRTWDKAMTDDQLRIVQLVDEIERRNVMCTHVEKENEKLRALLTKASDRLDEIVNGYEDRLKAIAEQMEEIIVEQQAENERLKDQLCTASNAIGMLEAYLSQHAAFRFLCGVLRS